MRTPTPPDNPFQRILLRPVAASDPLHGALFHLWWSAPHQGERVVQVYANGRLDTATTDPAQREAWLLYPPGRARMIKLRAVAPAGAFVPRDDVDDTSYGCAAVTLWTTPAETRDAVAGVAVDDGDPQCAPLRAGSEWRWRSEPLSRGDHTLTITQYDPAGREMVPTITEHISVDRLPTPPTRLAVRNGRTLTWS